MLWTVIRGLHEIPKTESSEWQPEPLHLPVADFPPGDGAGDGAYRDRIHPRDERDDDLPGSHVIIIDLA